MKITNVRTLILGIQWRNLVHVIVETDEGLIAPLMNLYKDD